MAEIEPASDEELQNVAFALSYNHAIKPDFVRRLLARLRAEQARADKAEAELARLKAAIAEAEKHAPEAVHFIRAMASTQGGGNG